MYYWLSDLLPNGSGILLDIGTQNQQSVKWFASRGLSVHAIDTQTNSEDSNSSSQSESNIIWYRDSFPRIKDVYNSGKFFDTVVLSNSLNKVPLENRKKAFKKNCRITLSREYSCSTIS